MYPFALWFYLWFSIFTSWLVPPVSDSEDEDKEEEEDLETRKGRKTKPCQDGDGLSQDLDGKTKKMSFVLIFSSSQHLNSG